MGLLDFDMNDPKTAGLLNLGLGILMGNTGRPGDLGQGIMQGYGNYQNMLQQQQRQKMLEQQQNMQNKEFGMREKEFDQKQKQYQDQESAIAEATKNNPQFGALFRLNPAAAIKAAFPAANGTDPYFTPIATANGLVAFDNRTGKYTQLDYQGQPLVKSTDSPQVRGAVKDAESQAAANWKPNTDIPGLVTTDADVVRQARGLPTNNFNTPYPVTFGAPGTTQTDVREGTTGEIPLRNPGNPRPRGISVPTEAELAGAKKEAEIRAESSGKKDATMSGLGGIIDEAKGILTGTVKPTASGFGAIMDAMGTAVGYAPEGAAEADKLKAIGGALVAKMPRMEGPQSNLDVENYKQMAGDVGNPTLPISRRLAALEQVETLWRKYDKGATTQQQQKPARSKADILKQYGVR
jgi:hypothetical protein